MPFTLNFKLDLPLCCLHADRNYKKTKVMKIIYLQNKFELTEMGISQKILKKTKQNKGAFNHYQLINN